MPVLQVYPLHEISIRLLRSGFHTLHLIIGSPSQANRGGGVTNVGQHVACVLLVPTPASHA